MDLKKISWMHTILASNVFFGLGLLLVLSTVIFPPFLGESGTSTFINSFFPVLAFLFCALGILLIIISAVLALRRKSD